MQQNPPNVAAPAAATANSTYTYNDYANWYKYYYGNYYGTGTHPGYAAQPAYPTGYPVQPQAPQSYSVPPPPGTEDQFMQASAGNVASSIAAPAKPAVQQSVPVPPPAPNIMKAHIGHKRPGLGSAGGPSNKKSKNKVPVPPVKCTICDITVSSEQVYITHVNGKSHKKKAASLINLATQDASATTTSPASNQSPSKKKAQKKNQKRAAKTADPTHQPSEQVVYQCDLCSVTVNSQQQLDLHLTGAKHKKTMKRLSKSNDPEILAKLSKMKDQVQKLTHLQATPEKIQPVNINSAPLDPPGTEGEEHNLPSGYVFIPASQSQTGKDTYLCSICQHQSTDLFTLNVHVNSDQHKQKVAEQEKPLEINQEAIDERLNSVSQEKAVSSKTNFDLRVHQTSNASTWKPNAKTFTKRMLPLSASFVSGEVLK